MYSVIIVDDEPWAIKGIRNAFDWNTYGFEVTGQFTSAHKALAYINEQRPDLVFTDIRMPEISGLDLIRATKESGLDVEFVIVSGFSEFAYAQEALRNGALDYFLKPIDLELADPLIAKLAAHFVKKQGMRNHLLIEALTLGDRDELKRLTPFFDQASDVYYRAMVRYSGSDEREGRGSIACFDAEHTLEVALGARKTLYIRKGEQPAELAACFDSAAFAGLDTKAAGMSGISKHEGQLARLIKEADMAASRFFIHEDKGVFEYEHKLPLVKPLIDGMSTMLQEKTFEGIEDMGARTLDFFRRHRLGMGEVVYLWNQAVGALVGAYYEELRDMELDFLNYSELKERFENLASLCGYLQDIFTYLKELNSQAVNEGDVHAYFAQMIKYIDNHYQHKLYLKDLSAKFFINQVYCCQLFKKHLGKTFSEYVTELRIKKACELLKHSELSIEEIAAKSGYVDYYYFNKAFKKQCGITPAKFRKS